MAKRAKEIAALRSSERRKLIRLGPGSILAVLAAAALFVSGKMAEPKAGLPASGRLVYEADASGKMRRVEAPSPAVMNVPPLCKPEPHWLLQHQAELSLNPHQAAEVRRLDEEWTADKRAFYETIGRSTSDLEKTVSPTVGHQGASMPFLKSGLADYSELSRQYESRRAELWQRAVSLLSTAQREKAEALGRGRESR